MRSRGIGRMWALRDRIRYPEWWIGGWVWQRQQVAVRSRDPGQLDRLAYDSEWTVRALVARNGWTSLETLEGMLDDPHFVVKTCAEKAWRRLQQAPEGPCEAP